MKINKKQKKRKIAYVGAGEAGGELLDSRHPRKRSFLFFSLVWLDPVQIDSVFCFFIN